MHGYELRKRLNLLLGWGRLLSYGSLYPALKRLLRAGWITEVTATTPGVSRRQRIVYQITAGRHGSTSASRSPTSVRPRGRTTTSTCGSRSSPAPTCRGPAAHPRGTPSRLQERLDRAQHSSRRDQTATTATSPSSSATASSRSSARSRWLTDLINAERADGDRPVDAPPAGPRPPAGPPPPARPPRPTRPPETPQGRNNPHGFGTSSNRGSRQLRDVPDPGRRVLQGRRPRGQRPGSDARHVRRLPRLTTSSSSPRSTSTPRRSASTSPRRSQASENNTIKICDVPPLGVDRAARPHPRRPRQVLPRDHRGVRRRAGRRRRRSSRTPRPTCSSPTSRWAPSRPTSSTPSARSTPAWPSSTRSRSSSPPTPSGPRSSRTPASRSSATTSSRQVGATITHRVMAKLFEDRGVALDRTYQLNVGGNMDFKNMLERDRLESKKVSKTQSVTSNLHGSLAGKIARPQRAHRPVRLRRVARRPQVGLRPPRGPRVRRRPAEPGVQARGLGLPQLRRHHHRRDPRREDRHGPRPSAARSSRRRRT